VALTTIGGVGFGQFSFAATLASGILLVYLAVGQVAYPRLAFAYGRSGAGGAVIRQAVRYSALAVGASVVAAAAITLVGVLVVRAVLPEYGPAVPALLILLVGGIGLSAANGFANAIVVLDRAWWLVVAQVLVAGWVVACGTLLVSAGLDIVGIAIASASGAILFAAFTVLAALWLGLRGGRAGTP
jgi:O-antigen/teichoic acid export membrane protein